MKLANTVLAAILLLFVRSLPSGLERQTLIHCDELAKGWVCVHAETLPADTSRLPDMLNNAFCRW